MQFYDNTISQIEFLKRRKKQLRDEMKKMPKGRMIRKLSRGTPYFYEEMNGKITSLYGNHKRQKAYLRKRKIESQLEAIERNITLLDRFCKRYEPLTCDDEYWYNLQEDANDYMDGERKHKFNGKHYRSKSEITIVERCTSFDLEVKYETPFELNGRIVYPDFVVRRKRNGKIFVWEHFGRTDDKNYLEKAYKKIVQYHEAGLHLWDNFIITFDKEDGSLDVDYIDKVIKLFLL